MLVRLHVGDWNAQLGSADPSSPIGCSGMHLSQSLLMKLFQLCINNDLFIGTAPWALRSEVAAITAGLLVILFSPPIGFFTKKLQKGSVSSQGGIGNISKS